MHCCSTNDLDAAQLKISKADFHGCLMTVSRSKCPSVIGTTGIMIKESKHMFNIITKKDELKGEKEEERRKAWKLTALCLLICSNSQAPLSLHL